MLIGIDGNEANIRKKLGIGEFAYELLIKFHETKADDLRFVTYLKGNPLGDFPKESKNWSYKIFGPKKFWTQFALPFNLYAGRPRPDIFFTPTHYSPRFSPMPTVVSVMDLSFIYFPELFKKRDLFQLKNWTLYSVKKAKKIITISSSTKNDIIKEYNVPEEKVVVVYPGIKPAVSLSPQVYPMNQMKIKYGISGRYVLFVGTLQPRKNISRLIEAFAEVLKSEKEELQLVVIGKKGWLFEEILHTPSKLHIEDKVKFLDFVPDEDLAIFYKHAACFVLPSLYEGFGLPVLEAMKYGCPVITSKVSSLPEAGGDAAMYVDPESTEDIASKIKRVLGSEKLREEMIAKGKKQVAKFNWEKTAKETLKILKEVAINK